MGDLVWVFLVLFVALTKIETPPPLTFSLGENRAVLSKDQLCRPVLTLGKLRHVEGLTCGRYPDTLVAGGPALGCADRRGKEKEWGVRPRQTQGSSARVLPTTAASMPLHPTVRGVSPVHRTKLPTETKLCPSTLPERRLGLHGRSPIMGTSWLQAT